MITYRIHECSRGEHWDCVNCTYVENGDLPEVDINPNILAWDERDGWAHQVVGATGYEGSQRRATSQEVVLSGECHDCILRGARRVLRGDCHSWVLRGERCVVRGNRHGLVLARGLLASSVWWGETDMVWFLEAWGVYELGDVLIEG